MACIDDQISRITLCCVVSLSHLNAVVLSRAGRCHCAPAFQNLLGCLWHAQMVDSRITLFALSLSVTLLPLVFSCKLLPLCACSAAHDMRYKYCPLHLMLLSPSHALYC
jgi:hypothetical protein